MLHVKYVSIWVSIGLESSIVILWCCADWLYPFHPDLSLQNIHWKANFDLNSSIFQPYQAILSQSEGIRNPAEELRL